MKNKLYLALLLFLTATVSSAFIKGRSDCPSDDLYNQLVAKLSSYSLLKDYRVYLKSKKKSEPLETVYLPITLNRGVKYKFLTAQSSKYEGKLLISLYTAHNAKPEFLFATNYLKDIDKIYESIEFESESTVNCLIGLSFKDGKEGCGVSISSFLKNQ